MLKYNAHETHNYIQCAPAQTPNQIEGGEVTRSVQLLKDKVGFLHAAISGLHAKIHPVLRSLNPADDAVAEITCTVLGSNLQDVLVGVENAIRSVSSMIDAVDL